MGGMLILGIGNSLLSDEGVGIRLAEALAASALPDGARVVDGGTIGLALMPLIEDARSVLFLDAARLGGEAGAWRLFEGEAFDAFVRGGRSTPHDVGLADLVFALSLAGTLPERRALLAVQPGECGLGAALSPPVMAVMDTVLDAARTVIGRWAA